MFVDRQAELAFLASTLARRRPTAAQFILVYGRRRVGKTVLLRHWAESAKVPYTYWAVEKEPAALQRRKLFARLLGVEPAQAAAFDSWRIVGRLSPPSWPTGATFSSWTNLPTPSSQTRQCCRRFSTLGINCSSNRGR